MTAFSTLNFGSGGTSGLNFVLMHFVFVYFSPSAVRFYIRYSDFIRTNVEIIDGIQFRVVVHNKYNRNDVSGFNGSIKRANSPG